MPAQIAAGQITCRLVVPLDLGRAAPAESERASALPSSIQLSAALMCQHAEGDSVQVRRMRPVRLHRAVCFQCRERGHLRRDCTASAREPASAHGGEEGHPWLQNEAADFTSDAANYKPTADVAVWDMDRASWPACCEEEGGAEFEYESLADPSSTEDDEEGALLLTRARLGCPPHAASTRI